MTIDREEVARAMFVAMGHHPLHWGEAGRAGRRAYLTKADAAIANIMGQLEDPTHPTIYKAMIAKALKTQPEKD